jgi:hypothetical protein
VASAQYLGSPFSYNYVDVSYVESDISSTLPELTGYRGRLSFDSPDQARIVVEWEESENTLNGIERKRQDFMAGVGFISSQNVSMDLILDFKYLRGERSENNVNTTKSGYGIELGLRGLVHEMIEIDASAEYREFWVSEIGGRFGAQFQFTPALSIGAQYSYFDSEQKLSAGVRYSI